MKDEDKTAKKKSDAKPNRVFLNEFAVLHNCLVK